jgi:hypothetical protein
MNIVRFHDGARYCAALEAGVGRKYRHLVVITEYGVRVLDVPLDEPTEVLGPVTRRQLATFRRAGKVFGITAGARQALDAAGLAIRNQASTIAGGE